MKKLNTILSFASLAITSFLLVFLIFAWYATNKTASVEETTGRVADLDNVIDTVEYYNFESVSGNLYTVRQYVKHVYGSNSDKTQIRYYNNDGTVHTDHSETGYDGNFDMNEFDYLAQGYSKYLIKLTLIQGKSLGDLQFKSTASYFIGFNSDQNSNGGVTTDDLGSLSLSSVIKFGYLTTAPTIANDHSSVTITNVPSDNSNDANHYEHFEYTNNGNEYYGAITASTKTIASGLQPSNYTNNTVVAYILVDYNLAALNAFYGYNLSTQNNWGEATPQFSNLDFKIFILG